MKTRLKFDTAIIGFLPTVESDSEMTDEQRAAIDKQVDEVKEELEQLQAEAEAEGRKEQKLPEGIEKDVQTVLTVSTEH